MGSHPFPARAALGRRPRRRVVTALRRQPLVFWVLALVAGASTYLTVDAATRSAAEGAAAYGDLVAVAVAERRIEPGEAIGADDATIRHLPAALVPDDAVAETPVGTTAREAIAAGEAIVAARLAPAGSIGIAAALGPDERAVAVGTDRHRAPIEVGQRVDVLATTDPSLAPGRNPTSVVAADARVLAVEEDGVTVAVPASVADRVATALATAVVTVVVAPG